LILIATICCWFVVVVVVVWTVGCCCWITVWFKITLTFVCEPIVWLSTRVVSLFVEICCCDDDELVNDGFVLKLNVFCVIWTFVLFVVFWLYILFPIGFTLDVDRFWSIIFVDKRWDPDEFVD